jgi:hypothetical protein
MFTDYVHSHHRSILFLLVALAVGGLASSQINGDARFELFVADIMDNDAGGVLESLPASRHLKVVRVSLCTIHSYNFAFEFSRKGSLKKSTGRANNLAEIIRRAGRNGCYDFSGSSGRVTSTTWV